MGLTRNQGAYISHDSQFMTMDDLLVPARSVHPAPTGNIAVKLLTMNRSNSVKQPDFLESQLDIYFKFNVTGVIKTINAFMPLIRKGNIMQVVVISSMAGDCDMINQFGFDVTGPYAMSKSAVNTAVALLSAIYKKEGVLFLTMGPGVVDTRHTENLTTEQLKKAQRMFGMFLKMKPDLRPLSPEESVRMCLDVTNKASVEKGDGGRFLSQHGNKEWL
jgi:NAD(P)-dependent dehydrogenase (short-subunit alcohol dehydrogenase family)